MGTELVISGALVALSSLVILGSRTAPRGAVRTLLVMFIVLHASHALNTWLMGAGFPGWSICWFQVPFVVNAALLPVTYLYLKKLAFNEQKWLLQDLWHVVLPTLVVVVMLPVFAAPLEVRRDHWGGYPVLTTLNARIASVLIGIGLLFYFFRQVGVLRNFYTESVSSSDSRQSEAIYRWIGWVNTMIFVFVATSMVYGTLRVLFLIPPGAVIHTALALPILGIMGYIVLNPEVLKALPSAHRRSKEGVQKVDRDLGAELLARNLHLDSDLSVFRAALELELSPKYFSSELKRQTGTSFTQWINEQRVAHSKKLLLEGALDRQTLEAVGLSSGFSSRSSFYRAFSVVEGCSPGAWLRQQH